MSSQNINILLADDDTDDCFFFNEAIKELPLSTHLTIVSNGEQLMNYLFENSEHLPDVLFLDLNMPRKTGFECLAEIKENEKLKELIVVMFSTSYPREMSYEQNLINMLSRIGAYHYIRKPGDFPQLKEAIHHALTMVVEKISLTNKVKP